MRGGVHLETLTLVLGGWLNSYSARVGSLVVGGGARVTASAAGGLVPRFFDGLRFCSSWGSNQHLILAKNGVGQRGAGENSDAERR